MSQLLDAIAAVANACEPFPGLVTGGQPGTAQLTALKAAGCEVVLDIRDPMEPRPIRVPDAIRAAGLEYINIPVGHTGIDDATFAKVRATVQGLVGKRPAFFHCGSGNRVGAVLIPYLMLDQGLTEEDATTEAMRIGLRNAGLLEEALDYVRRNS
jgi:protein tyrosine phosphatase (PTP) superfamily phosphohydrolase (DUF442 family)